MAVFLLTCWQVTSFAQTATRPPTNNIPTNSKPPTTTKPNEPQQSKPGVRIDVGDILGKILQPKPKKDPRPKILLIGDFKLTVESYSNPGVFDPINKEIVGASGTAWLTFNCADSQIALPFEIIDLSAAKQLHSFHVVESVSDPTNQISLKDAQIYRPDAKLGDHVDLPSIQKPGAQDITEAKPMPKPGPAKGNVLLHFDKVTIVPDTGWPDVGRIVVGSATYPTEHPTPKIITLSLNGFQALIDVLTLTPDEGIANINLQLPGNVGSAATCGPATLPLGTTQIKPNCEFYVEKPGDAFGPWIIGDTSLIASGTGYTADFSSSQSPGSHPADWRGVALDQGQLSGTATIPKQSNTGYLAADFDFSDAMVVGTGFRGLAKTGNVDFSTVDPMDYKVAAQSVQLGLTKSSIVSGKLDAGHIEFPLAAACRELDPNKAIGASFAQLVVQDDMDLAGEIQFKTGTRISWGELTHPGDPTTPWGLGVSAGCLYLPAGPKPTFSPDTGSSFISFAVKVDPNATLADMESVGMSGAVVGSAGMKDLYIYTRDRPNGTSNPLITDNVDGWMRIGHRGFDAKLLAVETKNNPQTQFGNPDTNKNPGYVGNTPFDTSLIPAGSEQKRGMHFEFCTSAAYDSGIGGSINLAEPAGIPNLAFADMKASSTANLLGGNIELPTVGSQLAYWKVGLYPTGDPKQAGVVSVRTGRLIFTAAGITEFMHFLKPFRLTWGEIYADGNLGELFFDYNPYGQKFDGLSYSPHTIALSKYVNGTTDGYLATSGSVHMNYFGAAFANIQDARNDGQPAAPFNGRKVSVPKTGEPGTSPTDLHLHGQWDNSAGNSLATMDFPDATMDYYNKAQDGFIGTGTCRLGFFGDAPVDATIEVHRDAIDVCTSSTATRDLDLGLYAAIGGLSRISGCARIQGPTLERMCLDGCLEASVSTGNGIVEPKEGYVVEVIASVTPSTFTFNASGDMSMAVAGSAVDLSGSIFLNHDYVKSSAEGMVNARINCNSVLSGLEGNGQITWYIDPSVQYLQGRMAMSVCTWLGGGGLEGGLFVGHAVPKAKVWVLQTSNGCYGVSQAQLPDTLTGVYGYGRAGLGWGNWLFSGGVDLYAGMGAFTVAPPGAGSAWDNAGVGLPYVVGAAGAGLHGEILGGIVSASGWANLTLSGPVPMKYEGTLSLEGCVLWVFCGSVSVTTGLNSDGFYLF